MVVFEGELAVAVVGGRTGVYRPPPSRKQGGAPVIEPIDATPSLKERVYQRIRELIMEGSIEFGEHLRETELATQLGVSRGPVREALQWLERDRWVELRPRHGAFVRQPSLKEIDDFFHVKRMLESEAALLCADSATLKEVDHLRELLKVAEEAMEARNVKGLTESNTAFHLAIATMSGNQVLSSVLERLENQLRFYFALMSGLRNRDAWYEHQNLIEAVAAGDPLKAALIMREHNDATREAYHEQRRAFEQEGRTSSGAPAPGDYGSPAR